MNKSHIMTLAIVGLLAFISPTTQAIDQPMGAGVNLFESALNILSTHDLVFGDLTIPTDDVAIWTLSPNGSLSKNPTTGNSVDLHADDHFPGVFEIQGVPSLSVNFSVAVTTNFSGFGLALSVPTMSMVSPQVIPAEGSFFVSVGASLTIGPTATPGPHNDAVITVTANY